VNEAVPPTVVDVDGGEMTSVGCPVTVRAAPLKLQPVAPLGAFHPDPLIVALPAATPVTVVPETLAIEELLERKLPPVQLVGAEAMLVPPTVMVAGVRVTALLEVGQEGGRGAVTV